MLGKWSYCVDKNYPGPPSTDVLPTHLSPEVAGGRPSCRAVIDLHRLGSCGHFLEQDSVLDSSICVPDRYIYMVRERERESERCVYAYTHMYTHTHTQICISIHKNDSAKHAEKIKKYRSNITRHV